MSAKPAKRNWNDVQIAIATAGIVTTLGMWNLFAMPAKADTVQTAGPSPTDPPTEPPVSQEPTSLPHVKVIFTPMAPSTQGTTVVQQAQPQQPQPQPKKKKHNNSGGGGSSAAAAAPVAQTKSS